MLFESYDQVNENTYINLHFLFMFGNRFRNGSIFL